MSRSVLNGEYRAAIALNNLAVSLQSQGREQDAVEAFRFALAAIKLASRQQRTEDERRDVEEKVRLASRRFMILLPSTVEHPFDVVSDDTHLGRLSELAEDETSIRRTLIRIEEYGDDTSSLRNLELDASIILHNYGISMLAWGAKRARSVSLREHAQYQSDGLKLLTLSHQVVSAFALESMDEDFLHKLLVVATVVIKSMAQAFHSLDFPVKVKECLEHLDVIGGLATTITFATFGDVAAAA